MSPRVMAVLLILVLHAAPETPTPEYLVYVVSLCAEIYQIDAELCECIVSEESDWNPNARGDNGKAVGLWQWHEESIRTAFRDMGIVWDWKEDPRLNVWASTLAACHSLSRGWGHWWSVEQTCRDLLGGIGE